MSFYVQSFVGRKRIGIAHIVESVNPSHDAACGQRFSVLKMATAWSLYVPGAHRHFGTQYCKKCRKAYRIEEERQ